MAYSIRDTVDMDRDWYSNDDGAEIIPGILWISNAETAWNPEFLKKHGIKAVLNASGMEPTEEASKYYEAAGIAYYGFGPTMHDTSFGSRMPRERFIRFMDKANETLNMWEKQGKTPMLVHCAAGINRSSACIIAFLTKSRGMEAGDAIRLVRTANATQRRAPALTNSDFEEQLRKDAPKSIPVNSKLFETDMVCVECGSTSISGKCKECYGVVYCGNKCQISHWPLHRTFCKSSLKSPLRGSQHPDIE